MVKSEGSSIKNNEWASYLTLKSCWSESEIIEDSSLNCSSVLLSQLDTEFPTGSMGVLNLNNIDFSDNLLTDIDFLTNLEQVSEDLKLSTNNLTSIEGLLNTVYVGGNLSLDGNYIEDYSSLSNIVGVGGDISIDTLLGTEILPNSGSWCSNKAYNSLLNESDIEKFSIACDNDYVALNNTGWASYLKGKYQNERTTSGSTYRCVRYSPINNGITFERCNNALIKASDSNYPSGKIGVPQMTNVNFSGNELVDLDFLTDLKTVTGYFNVRTNYSLVDISGLSGLVSVSAHLLLDRTGIKNYTPLSNLGNVSGLITVNELVGGEKFPTSGAWCNNNMFLNITRYKASEAAAVSCGNTENLSNTNSWYTYLRSKYQNDNHLGAYRCVSNTASAIGEGVSFSKCNNSLINTSDQYFPYGKMGIESLRDVNFSGNELVDLNFLEDLKTVTGYFNIRTNPSLVDISGLSGLTSVSANLLINSTGIKDYTPLSNLGNVGGVITVNELVGGEKFPTSGAWCDNGIYNTINVESVRLVAENFCLN